MEALLDLAKALKTAIVPLAFGLGCASSAGGLYAWLPVVDEPLTDLDGSRGSPTPKRHNSLDYELRRPSFARCWSQQPPAAIA